MNRVLALLIVFLVANCAMANERTPCEEQISSAEAERIASTFLESQSWRSQFLLPAERVTSFDCEWIVWFKNAKWREVKPSRGRVAVLKNSGEARWMASR